MVRIHTPHPHHDTEEEGNSTGSGSSPCRARGSSHMLDITSVERQAPLAGLKTLGLTRGRTRDSALKQHTHIRVYAQSQRQQTEDRLGFLLTCQEHPRATPSLSQTPTPAPPALALLLTKAEVAVV